jgi:protoporphyrinogen oxidase
MVDRGGAERGPGTARPQRVVVLGGGLTGLATAYHLGGAVPVIEAEAEAGGVARSTVVDGFTFDHTGHLLHFRDPRVERLLDAVTPGLFRTWERRASVWRDGVKTEYPFQVNSHGHPPALVAECLLGFIDAWRRAEDAADGSFRDWVLATFGTGFARHFFFPYNEKFWRRDLDRITADWVSWAIPRPSLQAVVEGALGVVGRGLGYNPVFRYPERGGIGQLAAHLAARVAGLRTGVRAVAVRSERREVELSDGTTLGYDRLVSTVPLNSLVAMSDLGPAWQLQARELDHVGVLNFNVGLARADVWPDHWTYFPEPDLPFYRVGVPTSFGRDVAPPGASSLYVEVTYRPEEPIDADRLWPDVLRGLERVGIVRHRGELVVVHPVRIPCAYVVFDRARQRVLPGLLAELARRGISSIGRYGAWEYSNMEKALVDGMEAAAALGGASAERRP